MKTVLPGFYVFESCTPEDVVYQLDYQNNTESNDYFQLFQDYGWEYLQSCLDYSMEQRTERIIAECKKINSANPYEIFHTIAGKDFARIHGPEHPFDPNIILFVIPDNLTNKRNRAILLYYNNR